MTALLEEDELYLTPEEYLAFEEKSEIKHEYVDGYVYAMSGASLDHNYIALNIASELWAQLRGKPYATFGSDKRLQIVLPKKTFYYYPDVTVDCSKTKGFHTESPTVIFEVTSPSTRRGDEGDKLLNYLNLPSMRVYGLVEQKRARITVHRRGEGGTWNTEIMTDLYSVLALPEIGCALPLRVIYDRVEFPAK